MIANSFKCSLHISLVISVCCMPLSVTSAQNQPESLCEFSGKIVDEESGLPIYKAHIRIDRRQGNSSTLLTSTESGKEGLFQLQLNTKDIQADPILIFYARDYEFVEIPISEIKNPNGILIQLPPEPGKIQIQFEGEMRLNDGKAWIVSTHNAEPHRRILIPNTEESVWVDKINPDWSPMTVWAGNGQYFGRSKIFSITDETSEPVKLKIIMQNGLSNTRFKFRIVDSVNGKPIKAAHIRFDGIVFHLSGGNELRGAGQMVYGTLSNLEGTADIDIPSMFAGKAIITQGLYHTTERIIDLIGDRKSQELTIKMTAYK